MPAILRAYHVGQLPQMGVAIHHGVETSRRKGLPVIHVAMGQEDFPSLVHHHGVSGQDGKQEQHLVDLGVAIAAHRHYLVSHLVQLLCHATGVKPLGQRVAWPIVHDVAQEQQHVASLLAVDVVCFIIFLTAWSRICLTLSLLSPISAAISAIVLDSTPSPKKRCTTWRSLSCRPARTDASSLESSSFRSCFSGSGASASGMDLARLLSALPPTGASIDKARERAVKDICDR